MSESLDAFAERTSEVDGLRQANYKLTATVRELKAKQAALVVAVYEGARDATLAMGPIQPVPAPKKDRRSRPEAALWHLTDWQGAKAVSDETPVLTTTGWKSHGNIAPGDYVYGPDGNPKRVLAVTGSTSVACSEIVFDGGVSVIASDDHLWQGYRRYKNAAGPYRGYERRSLIWTTKQIGALKPSVRGDRSYVERAFHVDLPAPLNLPAGEADLPIDPYVLGWWLGDGNASSAKICKSAADLAEAFPGLPIKRYVSSNVEHVVVPGLATQLRLLGLLGNKHIPEAYLMAASPKDRLALVQGLMDTDGTGSESGHCSFTNTNRDLVEGIRFLLASLGVKSSIRQGLGMLNGVAKKPFWEVIFRPLDFNPFRLSRKAGRMKSAGDQLRYRFVQNVTPLGRRSAQCLTVEGSLYLVGRDLIVTHNCTPSYNSEVMRERVMRFVDKAERITNIARADHPVTQCTIAFGGDMVEGLWNFPTQVFEVDQTIFGQFVTVANLIVDVVRRALSIYERVTVVAEWGNHGRIGNKSAVVPKSDNLDRMTYELARQQLKSEKRLSWAADHGSEDIQRIEIGAYRALLIHGDEIGRGGFASPMTIVRHADRWASGAYPWDFQDVYVGHYHNACEWSMANGRGSVYQTGSIESDNHYARDTMAATAIPSQRLHFIDPEKGRVTAQYKICFD